MMLATLTILIASALSSLVAAGSASGGSELAHGGSVLRHKARDLQAASAAPIARRQNQFDGNNGGGNNGGGGGGGNDEDPQTSLTLDPSQVQPGLALDGQQVPAADQVASATSVNNFINFCLTRSDLPLTNGAQVKTGSCNNVPMGVIGAQDKGPTSKFVNPPNLATIQADQTFTVQMKINNLITGSFVNAQSNYFAAPQNTNGNGIIIGHSHVVIEQIDSLESTQLTDSQKFAFFKGFNQAAVNSILSADVTGGLPAGVYKMSSINSASNHQPVLIGVAQHGSLDDAVYFTVSDNPAAESGTNGNSGDGGSGTGTTNDLPIGAGESAAAQGDGNLAPASTSVNIGAAQTSLLASVASSAAANGGGAAASATNIAASSGSASVSAQSQGSATAAQASSTGSRQRFGGRFTGGGQRFGSRFGGRRTHFARAEGPPAPTAALLKKRLAAMEAEEVALA